MMIPINPWTSYVASGGKIPSLNMSYTNEKDFLKGQAFLILICDIATAIIVYLGFKWDMFPALIIPTAVVGIPSIVFTYLWFKELFTYMKKLQTNNPEVKKVVGIERRYYVAFLDYTDFMYYREVKLEPGEKANEATFGAKLLGDNVYQIVSWSLIEE